MPRGSWTDVRRLRGTPAPDARRRRLFPTGGDDGRLLRYTKVNVGMSRAARGMKRRSDAGAQDYASVRARRTATLMYSSSASSMVPQTDQNPKLTFSVLENGDQSA